MGKLRLRVVTACPRASNEMSADVRERHCASCAMTVHNLSAMTEKEARRLLAGSDGRLCVYYAARPDGTIVSRRGGGWMGRAAWALGAAVLAVAFWSAVVLVQRPWQALARKMFGVQPPVPPTSADGRVSNGLPIDLRAFPAMPFYDTWGQISGGFMSYGGGVASPTDLSLIRMEQTARKPSGRK